MYSHVAMGLLDTVWEYGIPLYCQFLLSSGLFCCSGHGFLDESRTSCNIVTSTWLHLHACAPGTLELPWRKHRRDLFVRLFTMPGDQGGHLLLSPCFPLLV